MEIINRLIIFVLLIALLITLYKHQQYVKNNEIHHNKTKKSHKSNISRDDDSDQYDEPKKRPKIKQSVKNIKSNINNKKTKIPQKNDSVDDISYNSDDSTNDTNNGRYKKDSVDNISNDSIKSNLSFIDDNFFFQK